MIGTSEMREGSRLASAEPLLERDLRRPEHPAGGGGQHRRGIDEESRNPNRHAHPKSVLPVCAVLSAASQGHRTAPNCAEICN